MKTTPELQCHTLMPAPSANRVIPSGENGGTKGDISSFNLIFIVGFAILISGLARFLSTRRRK